MTKKAGRPVDWTAPARAEIKQLRGDAKRLETIAKRLREKASDLANEIKVQTGGKKKTEKGTFTSFKSNLINASVDINIPKNKEENTLEALESLFAD